MAQRLEVDTQPIPRGAGRYTVDLPNHWSFITPSGGVLLGIVMRAMAAELSTPAQRVVSATAVFCQPIREGPLAIEVDVLRKGGAASQLRGTLTNGADPNRMNPGLEVLATFARDRAGPDVVGRSMPKVASVTASRVSPTSRYKMPFFLNFEDRIALGHLWNESDWSAGEAHFGRWMRYRNRPSDEDGGLPEFALPPIADLMPPSLLQALGPEQARFMAPSLDLTMHFFERTKRDWVLWYGRCLRSKDGTASCAVELWDEDETLLAYGTQVMMLRTWRTDDS